MADKIYLSVKGYRILQEEAHHLYSVERPKVVETVAWAASNGDRSENGDYLYGKKRLREIDRRLTFLRKRLADATVFDASQHIGNSRIFLGAAVTYRTLEDNCEYRVILVGPDEIGLEQDNISFNSPLGKALLKAEVGDMRDVHTPQGVKEIEILNVSYQHHAR